MSTTLERTLYDAMTKYLMDNGVTDIVRVTSFEDRTEYGGCCETCEYEYVVVDLYYEKISGGFPGKYTYDGSFADLIRALS